MSRDLQTASLIKSWKRYCQGISSRNKRAQLQALQHGIGLLSRWTPKQDSLKEALLGQPWDLHLLELSPLYRQSRKLFLKGGGVFFPSLVTSPRTLGSASLLSQEIEYSPIEREYTWAAAQKAEWSELERLRSYLSNVYHEQNHRILWALLPPPPRGAAHQRRYLNFVESLVVVMDMALADGLGLELSSLFHLCGGIYDLGSSVLREIQTRREYRNYLQVALHATYLNLEGYNPSDIVKAIRALFPEPDLEGGLKRIVDRSMRLDRNFVEITNPVWQTKHRSLIERTYAKEEGLTLSKDPLDHRLQYLWAEKWFDLMLV